MNQTSRSNSNYSTVPNKRSTKRIFTIFLTIIMLSSFAQVNIFAQDTNSELPVSEPVESAALPVAAAQTPAQVSTFSVAAAAPAVDEFTITYHSNYPASLSMTNTTYMDPIVYKNEMLANATTLAISGFTTPVDYYFVGWNIAPDVGTAKYVEGENLGKIDVDWHLYAIWAQYRLMDWTIKDSTYTSDYNAQSHTNLITWPTAYSTAWAGEVISGLTYEYSVNGGAYSTEKPNITDAGTYTVTVKASAPRYKEITTTVNIVINKANLLVSPDNLATYQYGSVGNISHVLPAVNETNGPKSQSDANEINALLTANSPIFNAIDSSSNIASNLNTALPGDYTVRINSSTLANLQANYALRNYNLSASESNFTITSLSGLTVDADALNTEYDSTEHDAVNNVTTSVTNATLEYSIDGGAFTNTMPQIKDAGTYTIQIRASAPGYNSATITRISTITTRTAYLQIAQHSKTQGAQDPAFSSNLSGVLSSDTINYTLSRVSGEDVGRYAITAQVVANKNYTVVVTNGYLDILAAAVAPVTPDTTDPSTDDTTDDTTDEDDTTEDTTEPSTETTPDTTQPDSQVNEGAQVEEEAITLDTELSEEEVQANTQVNIEDANLPLSLRNGTWALLNLLLTIFTALLSLILLIGYFVGKRREDEDEDEEMQLKRKGIQRVFSIAFALASVIIFILTQDMTMDMIFVDRYTIIFVVVALFQIILGFFSKKQWVEAEDTTEAQTA